MKFRLLSDRVLGRHSEEYSMRRSSVKADHLPFPGGSISLHPQLNNGIRFIGIIRRMVQVTDGDALLDADRRRVRSEITAFWGAVASVQILVSDSGSSSSGGRPCRTSRRAGRIRRDRRGIDPARHSLRQGSIVTAPRGTGLYDPAITGARGWRSCANSPSKPASLLAMGTCAAFGEMSPPQGRTRQFDRSPVSPRRARAGSFPPTGGRVRDAVVNVSCWPTHPHTMTQTLAALAGGSRSNFDAQPPEGVLYYPGPSGLHAERISRKFTTSGTAPSATEACMFFNLGCQS